ncbi:MAG: hypothetical protein A2W91_18295 [Bacteroidetes bacterium GWF2_38_335]|nr:MAG: hypothetical protein A2W91_18295 [Bacteroidetes bacterium GWF2_38_335]OFY80084.1 MAG: hypothetical protein A2281_12340 [Bacteroidetes bacterium RIFOXYA12_FULL_38_20]HBS88591.1 hypothetical protein [Bacteroidales bacterium]
MEEDNSENEITLKSQFPTYYEKYQNLINYIPSPDSPVKTVMINFIVMQKDDGTGNFQNINDNSEYSKKYGVPRLLYLYNGLNQRFSKLFPPSDYINGVVSIADTRIRFELNNIYFYRNSKGFSSNNIRELENIIGNSSPFSIFVCSDNNRNPDHFNEINIFFTESENKQSYGSIPLFNDCSKKLSQVLVKGFNEKEADPTCGDWANIGGIVHETCHNFGLGHTYLGGGTGKTVEEMKENEDWHYDVFGLPFPGNAPHITSSCNSEECKSLPLYNWDADPYDTTLLHHDRLTNNIMSNQVGSRTYLSPLQIAKMQRSTRFFTINKYINDDCYDSDKPLIISKKEYWNFFQRLFEDLIIENRTELTITSQIELPAKARIVIKSGCKIILDGGTISGVNNSIWKGTLIIENGGVLLMKNNGKLNMNIKENIVVQKGGGLIISALPLN